MWDGQSGFRPIALVSDETHLWLGAAREIEMNCLGPEAGGIRHGIWCLTAPEREEGTGMRVIPVSGH